MNALSQREWPKMLLKQEFSTRSSADQRPPRPIPREITSFMISFVPP